MKLDSSSISAITEVVASILQKRDDDAQSAITGLTTGTTVGAPPCNIGPPGNTAAAAAASNAGVSYGRGRPAGGGRAGHYIGTNFILNFSLAARLPVTVHPQLPHLYMPLGSDDLAYECHPIIPAMVDSCAAVNTMRSQWILTIVKRYPYIFKAVVDSHDGRQIPLILCSVVGNTAT